MKLIVGLGNPGAEYKNTRHNIGFMAIDSLASDLNLTINKEKMNGLYEETFLSGEKVIFLKPQNYINLSGEVISDYMNYYNIDINDILIIHDDLDLDVGKFKIKTHGGSAGHNGLKSIENHLKTDVFNRIKIGISNNKDLNTKDYVLGKLSKEEVSTINEVIIEIKAIILDFVKSDMLDLMNRYNKK